MNWLKEEVERYYDWLKQNTFVQEDKDTGWGVISMPFRVCSMIILQYM